jgi:hypothetical protein
MIMEAAMVGMNIFIASSLIVSIHSCPKDGLAQFNLTNVHKCDLKHYSFHFFCVHIKPTPWFSSIPSTNWSESKAIYHTCFMTIHWLVGPTNPPLTSTVNKQKYNKKLYNKHLLISHQ